MSGPPRTVKYEGLYPSQIRERFEREAEDAAVDDWYPTSESWQGGVLYVTFEHEPGRRERAARAAAAHPAATAPAPAHAPAPAMSMAPMPQWRRAALVGVTGVAVLALVSVTLLGFGGWDRPGTVYGNPVSMATAAPGGLGPRAEAIAFLESNGFTGAVSPVGDGQEHWLGQGSERSVAELLGPAGGLYRATVTVFPAVDVGVGEIAQPTAVLRFLDVFAPGSAEWATAHTDDAVAARGATVRQRFGDRIVAVSALDGEDTTAYTYAVTQADAPARSRKTPRPAAPARTFSDGTWVVGGEVRPGTYRATSETACSWARLGEPAAGLEQVIGSAAGSGSRLVTVGKRDASFRSNGCGRWTSDLSRITDDRTTFGDGMFLVGEDIAAGTYRSAGSGTCSWSRLSGFGGSADEVTAGAMGVGPQEVVIRGSDKGFASSGCGGWTRL
ncbi:MAG: hypothetical protein ABWZ82_00620 [Candidatus Limnocylindrales bacterium]